MNSATQALQTLMAVARVARYPLAIATVVAGAAMLLATAASAEPYMTVRDGYKCSQCHVNKTGGGARTDYARVYLETRLAASPGPMSLGGNPGTANDVGFGRLTPFVSVNADLRTDFTYTDMDHASPNSQFNRSSTCGTCHAAQGGGKLGEVSIRVDAVPNIATLVYSADVVPNTNTREVYALFEKLLPFDGYVKAGTFRVAAGFQNTWDQPFQHVDQVGYQGIVGFETVRARGGLEVGFEPGPVSVSVSVSNPDPDVAATVTRGSRVVANAYGLSRFGVLGLGYATDPLGPKINRTTTEVYLGTSLGRFTALAQIDSLATKDEDAGTTVKQQAWLGEVDFLVFKGHNLRLMYEARDPDLDAEDDRRDRTSLMYESFLTPYLQSRLGYRVLAGPISATDDKNGFQVFGELHFLF